METIIETLSFQVFILVVDDIFYRDSLSVRNRFLALFRKKWCNFKTKRESIAGVAFIFFSFFFFFFFFFLFFFLLETS